MKRAWALITVLLLSLTACDYTEGTLQARQSEGNEAVEEAPSEEAPGLESMVGDFGHNQGFPGKPPHGVDPYNGAPGTTVCLRGEDTTVLEGSFTIETDDDLALLANVSGITGDLIVNVEDVTRLSLSCLRRIEGTLIVQGFPPCIVAGITETIDLPALTSVGALEISFNEMLHSVNLPSLQTVRGSVIGGSNPALTTFHAPQLTRVNGDLSLFGVPALKTFGFPELRWAKGKVELSHSHIVTSVALPKLVSAGHLIVKGNKLLSSVDVGSLEYVDGLLVIGGSPTIKTVSLAKLQETGGLHLIGLDACTSIGMPQLRWVGEEGFTVSNNLALTSAWVPQLKESLGFVSFVSNDSLSEIYLPALESIGSDHYDAPYSDSFSISGNDSLEILSVPVLKNVHSKFRITNNGALVSFDVPVLLKVGWDVRVSGNDTLVDFDFPKLHNVRSVEVFENPALKAFTIDNVYELTGHLEVSENASLTSINMDYLHLARGVTIDANPSYAHLSLPKLKEVGDMGLFVTNNPKLTELALHGVDRVWSKMHGFTIAGNDALTWFVLPSLKSVLKMTIEDNSSLKDFCIPQLTEAGSPDHWYHPLTIRNNASLGWFVMPSLTTIDSLIIEGNPVLSSLGMHNLKGTWDSYHRNVVIKDNPSLTQLPFSSLALVTGSLEIEGNSKLSKLLLAALTSVGENVLINDNESLAQCMVAHVIGKLDVGGQVEIDGNDESCFCEEDQEGLKVTCQ
jgi:hypothetical protein